MTPLVDWLGRFSDRCSNGFSIEHQHPALCQCIDAAAGKAQGIARADAAADPDARAAIDAAIVRLAATGEEWSANELRAHVPGITGAIMGARFSAAAKAGLIRDTGKRVPSTLGSTHAHEVRVWVGVAA
jgi:hypothetical protein